MSADTVRRSVRDHLLARQFSSPYIKLTKNEEAHKRISNFIWILSTEPNLMLAYPILAHVLSS
jgi:hypothetical protein